VVGLWGAEIEPDSPASELIKNALREAAIIELPIVLLNAAQFSSLSAARRKSRNRRCRKCVAQHSFFQEGDGLATPTFPSGTSFGAAKCAVRYPLPSKGRSQMSIGPDTRRVAGRHAPSAFLQP
jgi:hypothetical protein